MRLMEAGGRQRCVVARGVRELGRCWQVAACVAAASGMWLHGCGDNNSLLHLSPLPPGWWQRLRLRRHSEGTDKDHQE